MKILYVDSQINGHHFTYMASLLKATEDTVICVPKTDLYEGMAGKTYFVDTFDGPVSYLKWIRKIKKIVKAEKPDIVHFLYGDDIYRYFGVGLGSIKSRVIVTAHQIRRSRLRDISFKSIGRKSDTVVVHTAKLKRDFYGMGIKNTVHVEYPKFNEVAPVDKKTAYNQLNIESDAPVLLAIGGTRYDKGLDILLDALKNVKAPFHLIIAGKEEFITRDVINEKIADYKDKVSIFLEFLSDEKFALCLNACDIVVLPYRRSFDGASGPLGEGVALGKIVIGSNHGSLGSLITENHLGYAFECESVVSLTEALEKALTEPYRKDESYLCYKKSLSPEYFIEKYKTLYANGEIK